MPPDLASAHEAALERYRATNEHYLRMARLQPALAGSAYSDLGVALSGQGQPRAAAHAYATAIRLSPAHGVAYNNLAALLASGRSTFRALMACATPEPSWVTQHQAHRTPTAK